MMMEAILNGADKVLERLKLRMGDDADDEQLSLDVERARVILLNYCNIPLGAEVPQGLFEAWCMAAEQVASAEVGDVASISEGDVSVSFKKDASLGGELDWKAAAARFRRMAI